MTIQQLKPIKPLPVRTPQCSQVVEEAYRMQRWRQERYMQLRPDYDPLLCQQQSSFTIDGQCYCRQHAGQKALAMWVEGRLREC